MHGEAAIAARLPFALFYDHVHGYGGRAWDAWFFLEYHGGDVDAALAALRRHRG